MLRGAFLLCVLAAAALAQEDFFDAHGGLKEMTDCYGEKLFHSQLTRFGTATHQCSSQPFYIPGLEHDPNTFNLFTVLSTSLIPSTGYQRPVQGKSRTARQASNQLLMDRDTIQGLIDGVHAELSNLTCVLRTLEVIDDNLNIRLDNIQRQYSEMPIDPKFRQDLLEGFNLCYQRAMCLPVNTKNPLPPKLQRMLVFTKCENKQRVANCFKHNLRTNLFRYDLSALPDGGHVGKLEKLMAILVGSSSLEVLGEL